MVYYHFKFSFALKAILSFANDDFIHGDWAPLTLIEKSSTCHVHFWKEVLQMDKPSLQQGKMSGN